MTEPGTRKRCPDCAELVQVDARICRFCRFNFETAIGADEHVAHGSAPNTPEPSDSPVPARRTFAMEMAWSQLEAGHTKFALDQAFSALREADDPAMFSDLAEFAAEIQRRNPQGNNHMRAGVLSQRVAQQMEKTTDHRRSPAPHGPIVTPTSTVPTSNGGMSSGVKVLLIVGAIVVGLVVIGSLSNSTSDSPSVGSPSSPVDIIEDIASDATPGQDNARRAAESYLEYTAFSRSGLIKQLKFEGYSLADATYGVDAVSPDWSEQAARAAESYLEYTAFSRSGLIQQLEFEGYTTAQAVYGVNQAGL